MDEVLLVAEAADFMAEQAVDFMAELAADFMAEQAVVVSTAADTVDLPSS